jgi:hypothetical protein
MAGKNWGGVEDREGATFKVPAEGDSEDEEDNESNVRGMDDIDFEL